MHSHRWLISFACAGAIGCGGAAFSAASGGDAGSVEDAQSQTSPPDGAGPDAADDASLADVRTLPNDALADPTRDADRIDGTVPDAASRSDADANVAVDADADAGSSDADSMHDGSIDGSIDGSTDAGLADSAVTDASGDGGRSDAREACVPSVYYLDGDGDHFGGTTTSTGCAPPDGRAWVLQGGDCDDSNAQVNPGQTSYFAQSYIPTGKTTPSFDYDCDGQETESGASAKAACALSGLSCVGSGYLEASPVRSGPGVDAFCGSAQTVACSEQVLSCVAGSPQSAAPITCK